MPVDIEAMAPEAVAEYYELGQRYATANVLAQADKVVAGLDLYAAVLAEHGFGPEDRADVIEARDDLRTQETGSAEIASERRAINQSAEDVIANAKQRRRAAITILKSVQRVLRQRGAKAALATVKSALSEARILTEDSQLPRHLTVLLGALVDSAVTAVVATRGGLTTAADLAILKDSVRVALEQRTSYPPSTAAAQRRDILDGILVTLARNARAAARMAARSLGQPAIATAFELVHLESPRTRRAAPATPEAPAAPTAPVASPAVPGGNVIPLK
jgi:hypothetical protein